MLSEFFLPGGIMHGWRWWDLGLLSMKKRSLTAVFNHLTGGYAGAAQWTARGSRHKAQQRKLSRKFHNRPVPTEERSSDAKDRVTRVMLFIHAHEVSRSNRGTPNAVLHKVLIPFRHSDATWFDQSLLNTHTTVLQSNYNCMASSSTCFFLDPAVPGVGLATVTMMPDDGRVSGRC